MKRIAEIAGVKEWQVRRLYEEGTLPDPGRFAGKRAIPRTDIPKVVLALQKRGWLPDTTVEPAP
jgi:hypothetical protein